MKRAWLAVAMTLAPCVALAHVEKGTAAGFLSGFTHPFSGWDHVFAMVVTYVSNIYKYYVAYSLVQGEHLERLGARKQLMPQK